MTNKIQISIPVPCGENWNAMSTSEKGKFCVSCQKNVIDFTTFSDKEILKYYNQNSKICGRFTNEQLNRNLVIPKEKSSIWILATASILTFLGLGSQTVKAQETVKTEQTDKKTIPPTITTNNNNEAIEIKGKIFLDEINPNFEEVEISLSGKKQIFHPDADGKFCIDANKNDTILINKTGYINYYTLVIRSTNLGAIELESENSKCQEFIVGGAVAVKRSFWYRLFH